MFCETTVSESEMAFDHLFKVVRGTRKELSLHLSLVGAGPATVCKVKLYTPEI